MMKYILVTGGVISGIGKGVIASSLGTLLKACNLRVTSIKIDPYINIDAGMFSPYEHGEVFVLDDGGEVDLDLGNYERFLDISLHRSNNITTGKIYKEVIDSERLGKYLGQTVQVVPHITDAIKENVISAALKPVDGSEDEPQVCIVELGGTIGDIEGMPFREAFRQLAFKLKEDNFCSVHVSLVPQPKSTGEQKTKPTQESVKALRGEGLAPDLIVCRSETPITDGVRNKISMFCQVPPEQVIGMHDVPSIYRVPVALEEQGVLKFLIDRLKLPVAVNNSRDYMTKWRKLADSYDSVSKVVKIALVGKYTKLEDAYASVIKALQHSALHLNYRLQLMFVESESLESQTEAKEPVRYHEAWRQLCSADGIIVPGGFGERGIEGKISATEWARAKKKPFLGVCLGMHCAVIEFARNALGLKDANSKEFDPKSKNDVIIDMPEHNTVIKGGTMRLGKRTSYFKHKDSILFKLYGKKDTIEERHRHRYEVNLKYINDFEARGLRFVAKDESEERMEMIEFVSDPKVPNDEKHPYFVGVQFHPEYLSRPLKPSPPYLGLILASTGQLGAHFDGVVRTSPVFNDNSTCTSDDEEAIRNQINTPAVKNE